MGDFKPNSRPLIAIAIIMLILIQFTSCAPEKSAVNQNIAQYLNINKTKNLDSYIQDLNLKSSKDGITVDVKQSFGNEKTVYIAFEVLFPDDVKLPSNDNEINIMPQTIQLISDENNSLNGFSGIYPICINKENNSISYIYFFDGEEICFNGTKVTLTINEFRDTTEDGCVSPNSFSVSWNPTNISKTKTFDILDKHDKTIGYATLSPLSLSVAIDQSVFVSYEELIESVKLIGTDGTALDIKWRSSGSSDNNMRKAHMVFNELIDPDTMQKIIIDDYAINLQ
ncbi:MAG: hypothetical protein GX488_10045 [Clostridiales bacterium]|nr:hypothetical protein [Clostridiales bacterium]